MLPRVMSALSVLLIAAGVTVYVLARRDDVRASAAPRPSTSTVEADPRARIDNPSAALAFVSAASSEVVAVTQSDYRSLDATLQAGLSVTTGSFRTTFQAALTGSAAAARVANHLTTDFQVLAAGIGQINKSATQAIVMVVGTLQQTGDDIPAGQSSVVTSLCATVVRQGNQYLISALTPSADPGLPAGTTGFAVAAASARAEVANVLTFTRKDFTADSARAQNGATGMLLNQLTDRRQQTLAAMTAGGYDLTGTVTAMSAQQISDSEVVLLVAATQDKVADDGTSTVVSSSIYSVLIQRLGPSWLVGSMVTVGGS